MASSHYLGVVDREQKKLRFHKTKHLNIFLTFIQVYEFDFLSKVILSIGYPVSWYFIAANKDEKDGFKRLIKW